ncbi:MAG TPA: hypothetical protein VGO47_14960, partial [Chlamydiales bacterium]|nr:hypothetical protein [Chlamydiales bacterium]
MSELKPVWKQVVERKHPPLFMDFLLRGQDKSVFERATGISFCLTNVRKVKLGLFVDSTEMQALMRILNDRYEQDGASFFREYAERCYKACRELLETAEGIGAKKHPKLPNKELIENFRLYDQRVLDVAAFLESIIAAQWVLEKLFDQALTAHLMTQNMLDQKDRLKASLSVPQEDNFIVQSIRDLNRIEAQIQESKELRDFFQQPTQLVINSIDQV